jgi:hypothetical protein
MENPRLLAVARASLSGAWMLRLTRRPQSDSLWRGPATSFVRGGGISLSERLEEGRIQLQLDINSLTMTRSALTVDTTYGLLTAAADADFRCRGKVRPNF